MSSPVFVLGDMHKNRACNSILLIFVYSAADELADQRLFGDVLLVDIAEELECGQNLPQLVKAFDPLRNGAEQLGRWF